MKLAAGVLVAIVIVVAVVMRISSLIAAIATVPDAIADWRRSWKVAVLWTVCILAGAATGLVLAVYEHRLWLGLFPGTVAIVTFIYANVLAERLRPSPVYSDRDPDETETGCGPRAVTNDRSSSWPGQQARRGAPNDP